MARWSRLFHIFSQKILGMALPLYVRRHRCCRFRQRPAVCRCILPIPRDDIVPRTSFSLAGTAGRLALSADNSTPSPHPPERARGAEIRSTELRRASNMDEILRSESWKLYKKESFLLSVILGLLFELETNRRIARASPIDDSAVSLRILSRGGLRPPNVRSETQNVWLFRGILVSWACGTTFALFPIIFFV